MVDGGQGDFVVLTTGQLGHVAVILLCVAGGLVPVAAQSSEDIGLGSIAPAPGHQGRGVITVHLCLHAGGDTGSWGRDGETR